ncbi:hypothetical protein P4O66_017461, partial [Electrophorus voltai]
MNQATYKTVLEENLLPSALTMFRNSDDCFFQQDNAPCDTARSIKSVDKGPSHNACSLQANRTMLHVTQPGQSKVWIRDHQIKTLSWPAQSPNLNPTKNLWNVIKGKLDGHKPSNKAELLDFCARS